MAQYTTIVEPFRDLGTTKARAYQEKTWLHVVGDKRLPIQNFRIKLSERSISYRPGDKIRGNVLISNDEDFGCLGIVVCLEGYASVSYQSGSVIRKRVEKLLSPDVNEWTSKFLVGCAEDHPHFGNKHYKIFAGDNVFPFQISTVKLNPFTGTFKGTCGEVNYRLIACVIVKNLYDKLPSRSRMRDFLFVEQSIRFDSYLNLETLQGTTSPITVENSNSFLSIKKLKASTYCSRTGFLPSEAIPFTLTVLNAHGRNISKFSASFICKTIYFSDVTSRVNSAILGIRENDEINFSSDGIAEWTDFLLVPDDVYPSISGELIQRQYTVKIEIYESGKENPVLKSCVPITIGSVREDESLSIQNRPLPRSMSLMSLTSNTGSFQSLPPSYSDIFSRAASMETLPPLYEDIFPGHSE